jgi:anti-anti-sigma factor
MPEAKISMYYRSVNGIASIIDIHGELTAFAEKLLIDTYTAASTPQTRAILLNFSGLEYMNSSGIGLIVTLLIRVNRQKQRLMAYGLNEHYQHIFKLTRLTDAIQVYQNENEAIMALRTVPGVIENKNRFQGRR